MSEQHWVSLKIPDSFSGKSMDSKTLVRCLESWENEKNHVNNWKDREEGLIIWRNDLLVCAIWIFLFDIAFVHRLQANISQI